jgi:chorismate mutase/prephenate dehydratase
MNPKKHRLEDDIDQIRSGIDDVDQKILRLLAQRRAYSVRAAKLKDRSGGPSRDLLREEDLIAGRIASGMDHDLDSKLVNSLWREIVDDSVRVQRDLLGRQEADDTLVTVAIQGVEGSYSQMAARQIYDAKGGPELVYRPSTTFADAVAAVQSGEADSAVLPIENSTSGGISEVYDLLVDGGLRVIGDLRFRVRHCLLGLPGADVDRLERVYAHPQAAAQCSEFLSALEGCETVIHDDTAGSGRRIAELGNPAIGAIASEQAARLYGLEILGTKVANRDENYTRFVVVSATPAEIPPGVPAKTSIVVTVGNHPGALMEALAVFTDADINLVKLESRPIPSNPTDELFYLDFAGALGAPAVDAMLDTLTTKVHYLKVLGSYPSRDLRPRPDPAPNRERHPRPLGELLDRPSEHAPAGYKLGSRGHKTQNTVVEIDNVRLGEDELVMIAGPCAVESWDQVMAAAGAVKRSGAQLLRGGCFKPRTSPYSFQGLGFEGLEMLAEAGRAFGLPIVTEVVSPEDVPGVAEMADVLQIGTRNMQNFKLLSAAGRAHRPVMLKRGMSASLDEFLQAAEYILAEGNQQVFLCERGIRTFETSTRNTLDLSAVPVLRGRTHLPIIVDPSHAAGERSLVSPLAYAAAAIGAHGIMVEIHPNPDSALSDGAQSLTLDQFAELMDGLGFDPVGE